MLMRIPLFKDTQWATNKQKRASYQPARSEHLTGLFYASATHMRWTGQSPAQEIKLQGPTS